MDSNFRYRGRRPASGRSLRAQRVETDAAKREFGSDSCLFSPPWGGSGGLGGGLCFPFPTPGNGQQEGRLAPIGRLLRRGVLRTGFPRQAAFQRLRRVLVRFASDSPLEASGARGLTSQTILPHSWPLHSKTCTATRLARSHIPSGPSDDAGRICKTISKRAAYITRTDSCTVERSLTSSTAGLPRAVAFRATRRKS